MNVIEKLENLIAELKAEKPDPFAEIKAAIDEGKEIEVLCGDGKWRTWRRGKDFGFTNAANLRVKPESILTPQQISDGWKEHHGGDNPVPGKKVSVMLRGKTQLDGEVAMAERYCWVKCESDSDIVAYKIIEPRIVQLGPDDVRCGDEAKRNNTGASSIYGVAEIHIGGVYLHGDGFKTWDDLKNHHVIRRRDSDTFVPCSKEDKQ